jgi:hypothetical protein
VDDGRRGSGRRKTARMSIELPAAEVYRLSDTLRGLADVAGEAAARLGGPGDVGGDLQPAVEAFLAASRTAALALDGELRWLGGTVAGVADSWLALDGSLFSRLRRPGAE